MSTRWYPIFCRGNPQLRVFLPSFYMKLIKPATKIPENHVQFIVSMEMTRFDVRNYLEKIYKIPVTSVKTKTYTGDFKKSARGYLIKEDDYRVAYVKMPKGCKFTFPENLFTTNQEKEDKLRKSEEEIKKDFEKYRVKNSDKQDAPPWFSY